jgi:hypothetical protein
LTDRQTEDNDAREVTAEEHTHRRRSYREHNRL